MGLVDIFKLHKAIEQEFLQVESYLDQFLHFEHDEIAQSALHTLHAGGKRLRPAIVIMTASFFDNTHNIVPLAAAMELVHMSSLIHDDIIDRAATRRGKATLNELLGANRALHTGDYILCQALDMVRDLPHGEEIVKILSTLDIEMCYGEIEQINSMYDTKQTIDDYYYRINRKTALLIAVCCQSGALASGADEAQIQHFYNIGYNMGMAFQIKDDLLDMQLSSKALGKPAGSDLAHGIMTLPTILVLQKDFAAKEELLQLITNRFSGGQKEVERALAIIKKEGGIEEGDKYCRHYIATAKKLIAELPENKGKRVFAMGAEYIIERNN